MYKKHTNKNSRDDNLQVDSQIQRQRLRLVKTHAERPTDKRLHGLHTQ